jgi:hypothetical protein
VDLKLSYENSFYAICQICQGRAYGELFGGVFVCNKCIFPRNRDKKCPSFNDKKKKRLTV